MDAATDTTSYLYKQLVKEKSLKLLSGQPAAEMEEDLKKGHITAIIRITSQPANGNAPSCRNVKVRTSA